MIDIIVLTDGTLEDLKQTLFSIAYQDSSELVNVYLMNNKKTKSFKDLVSYFMNFINIKELECFSCKSLCEIKQYGIDNSTNDYIMFMESGSMLEGNIVIKNIIKYLYDSYPDLLVNKQTIHYNGQSVNVSNEDSNLFGKVYKRELLSKKNIRFIKDKITEDIAFNKLCSIMSSNAVVCDMDFYIRKNNTDYQKIINYVQNMYYVANNKSKSLELDISRLSYSLLAYIYLQKFRVSETEYTELLKYADKFKKIYSKNPLDEQDKLKILNNEYHSSKELDDIIWNESKDYTVDIIIPSYNAHGIILKTLMSVALQDYKSKIHVYIVDDYSKTSYEKEVDLFKNEFEISLLKLDKNSGPGMARQYAIERSNGDFILFLDSDDLLYKYNVVSRLVRQVGNNDIIQGYVLDERHEDSYLIYNDSKWDVHGKLYRRELLNTFNIEFLDSRKSEDDAFHKLCLIATDKVLYVDDIIYFYRNNSASIVNSDDDYFLNSIDDYINNMTSIFKMSEERNLSIDRLSYYVIEVFLYTYETYMKYMNNKNINKMFINIHKLYDYYKKYKDIYSEESQLDIYNNYMWEKEAKISLEEYISIVEKI